MAIHRPPHSTDPMILAGRLATGWVMCDQEADPVRREHLEDFWIHLLHDYERAVDRDHASPDLAAVAPPNAPVSNGTRSGTPHPPRVDRSHQEVA